MQVALISDVKMGSRERLPEASRYWGGVILAQSAVRSRRAWLFKAMAQNREIVDVEIHEKCVLIRTSKNIKSFWIKHW